MIYKESIWNSFRRLDFDFDGKQAILICPEHAIEGNKWLFKTEYFDAFPEFEIEMVKRGYHLAHVENTTRWGLSEDTERQARFAKFLATEFGLAKQSMLVGMSCGGMQAVYLAGKYPELVAAMYLDAPVLNLLSCPCGVGDGIDILYEEYVQATGKTVSDLINYREHPIDYVDHIVQSKIPVFLVAGDSDDVVPYHENGYWLAKAFEDCEHFYEIIKSGCGHHPHGLSEHEPLIAFTEKYY